MIIVLTDGMEVFETRTGVSLMEWDKLNKQAQEATDGNLYWEARIRHFFCPDICTAGSEYGCSREEEMPEDAEITDNPDDALCPCFTLSEV